MLIGHGSVELIGDGFGMPEPGRADVRGEFVGQFGRSARPQVLPGLRPRLQSGPLREPDKLRPEIRCGVRQFAEPRQHVQFTLRGLVKNGLEPRGKLGKHRDNPHAADILKKIVELAELLPIVPSRFSLPQHPKDDHLFDLAIQAQADYLVTWESRLLKLQTADNPDGQRLRQLAPKLTILNPKQLTGALKLLHPPTQ